MPGRTSFGPKDSKAQRARQYLTHGGVTREDSDDELGLDDLPWQWIYSSDEESRHGEPEIIGASMGSFRCMIGDCVLLKADGAGEAWIGLICEFQEDEEDDKVANFMWFSTEKEIRNKDKKRTDALQVRHSDEYYWTQLIEARTKSILPRPGISIHWPLSTAKHQSSQLLPSPIDFPPAKCHETPRIMARSSSVVEAATPAQRPTQTSSYGKTSIAEPKMSLLLYSEYKARRKQRGSGRGKMNSAKTQRLMYACPSFAIARADNGSGSQRAISRHRRPQANEDEPSSPLPQRPRASAPRKSSSPPHTGGMQSHHGTKGDVLIASQSDPQETSRVHTTRHTNPFPKPHHILPLPNRTYNPARLLSTNIPPLPNRRVLHRLRTPRSRHLRRLRFLHLHLRHTRHRQNGDSPRSSRAAQC